MDPDGLARSATCASSSTDGAITAIEFTPVPRRRRSAARRPRRRPPGAASRRSRQLAPTSPATSRSSTCRSPRPAPTSSSAVWEQLRGIGYGETASYGEIARRLGMTNAASRAVGLANGRNPIPIVIPCHRVIGANGTLTGYAGGLERKQTLLELEQHALF